MKDKNKILKNSKIDLEDKFDILKDGPDYEVYSENIVRSCNCSKGCSGCKIRDNKL